MIMFHEANLTNDAEQIQIIEKATSHDIIDAIYSSGNVPDHPDPYMDRITKLGCLWENRQLQTNLHSHPFPSLSRAPVKATPTTPASVPSGDKRMSTGIIHGGRGTPMDVDALKRNNKCFNCGEIGHLRCDCDKPIKSGVNVRSLAFNLTDEECQALADSLALARTVVETNDKQDALQDFLDSQ
jgi:hypothetical protein